MLAREKKASTTVFCIRWDRKLSYLKCICMISLSMAQKGEFCAVIANSKRFVRSGWPREIQVSGRAEQKRVTLVQKGNKQFSRALNFLQHKLEEKNSQKIVTCQLDRTRLFRKKARFKCIMFTHLCKVILKPRQNVFIDVINR